MNARELSGEYMTVVAVHEAVHYVRANNKAGYDVLKKFVRRYLELEGENVHALLKEIKENRKAQGENLNPKGIMEELVANTISSIASNEKAMQACLKMDAKERVTLRQVLQSIAERVKSIASKFTGAESKILLKNSDNLLTLAKEMNKALKDAGENVGTQKNTAQSGVRYSADVNENNVITMSDVIALRSIEKISVNNFTSEDIYKSEKWAQKFYKELGTKSPFFRAWFGDWRAYEKTLMNIPKLSDKTEFASGKAFNGDMNRHFSWDKHLGKESLLNASKNTKQAIHIVATNIDEIVQKAVLLDTVVSKPGSKRKLEGTAFMHSLYTVVEISGEYHLIKLYAEEAFSEKQNAIFTRAYTLKHIEIVANFDNSVHLDNKGLTGSQLATDISISELFEFVKKYDAKFTPKPANPIFLNEDGTLRVYYHGTDADFTIFDSTKANKRGLKVLGEGNYFTYRKSAAERYGQNVIDAYLKADNPYIKKEGYVLVADQINEEFGVNIRSKDVQDFLKQKGFDGVVVLGDDGKVVMANIFDSERIKSPSKNIGTFNLDKKDYRYSYGDESVDFWGVMDPMDEAAGVFLLTGSSRENSCYSKSATGAWDISSVF